jgi:alpha-galactosidase
MDASDRRAIPEDALLRQSKDGQGVGQPPRLALLRSDYQWGGVETTAGNQGHTYGLSSWIPYYGQGVYYQRQSFVYCVRSYMCPAFAIITDVHKNEMDRNLYRRLIGQWRETASCMLGDYYPLTSYSLEEDLWMAWQFDRPEQGNGLVQVFRRTKSPYETAHLKLRALDAKAVYTVTNLDDGKAVEMVGGELLSRGLPVALKNQPDSAVFVYKKKS